MRTIKAIIWLILLEGAACLSLRAQPTETYVFSEHREVPDGNSAGLTEVRNVNSAIESIRSMKVGLKISGEFNGDLYAYLRHESGFVVLLNRPGKTDANVHGYQGRGLDVSFESGATNGDIHLYQDISTPLAGSPLTGAWEADGRTADPAAVTEAAGRFTSVTNFNGLNAGGEWTLYLADLDSGGTNLLTEWSLELAGSVSPALSWSQPADILYGTVLGDAELNARATYSSTNVPGTFIYTPPAGTILNAGAGQTLSVTFIPADTTGFLPRTTNVTINVLRAPLNITANDTNKLYGAALPAFTATYSGFVNGDSPASLNPQVTLATAATAASPPGGYDISASGAISSNYNITHVNGELTIYSANHPPILAAITNVIMPPDGVLVFTVQASDPDGDLLNYSLDPGAPADASITNIVRSHPVASTNTIVRWRPTRAYASTTNSITVRVTDNGAPPMSATQTFVVIVQDYLELTIGSTNLEVGQSVSVPIYLASDGGVTNLAFTLSWPATYLTNVSLAITAPEIGSASLQDQITNLLFTMQTAPGQVLQGTQHIAQLSFGAASNEHSAFLQVPFETVNAVKPDASFYVNYIASPATTVVVEDVPLLSAGISTNRDRDLTLYGKLGATYQLQYTTNLNLPAAWFPLLTYLQTNGVMTLRVDASDPIIFYRLFVP
jgi:subtilisin-like proprotein convertase family protein